MVYDGPQPTFSALERACGRRFVWSVISSSNRVLLQLQASDWNDNMHGITFEYSSIGKWYHYISISNYRCIIQYGSSYFTDVVELMIIISIMSYWQITTDIVIVIHFHIKWYCFFMFPLSIQV